MQYFLIIYRVDNLNGFDPGNDLLFGAGTQYLTWRESGQYGPRAICAGWLEVEGKPEMMEPVNTLRLTGEAEFGPREESWIQTVVKSGWSSRSAGGMWYLHSKFHRVLDEPKDWEDFQSKLRLISELTTAPDWQTRREMGLRTEWDRLSWETCQRLLRTS